MSDDLTLEMLEAEAEQTLATCRAAGLRVTTAESCTGGLIVGCLTEVGGSSDVVGRGFVTYSNEAKQEMLGVSPMTVNPPGPGAVSEATVREMTAGALKAAAADADIAVAVSGVAGPGGGSPEKPVGTVWFCVERRGAPAHAEMHVFPGDRRQVRLATVRKALELVRAAAD